MQVILSVKNVLFEPFCRFIQCWSAYGRDRPSGRCFKSISLESGSDWHDNGQVQCGGFTVPVTARQDARLQPR